MHGARQALLVVVLLPGLTACTRKSPPKVKSRDATAHRAASPMPGIAVEGVGEVRVGQPLDTSRLRTDGPDVHRRWGRHETRGRVRFSRAYPISGAFGNRIRPTYIYLREEIWTHRGRVVHVGQGYTVVKQQCTPGMRAAHERLLAVVRACMAKGAFVLREPGRLPGLVHYLCERGPVALMIDLLPRVVEFTDERETRPGRFSVSQFWREDVADWLRQRFARGEPSDAKAFVADLAPLTRHLAGCKSTHTEP
jgi:hypothetical protein